MGGYTLEDAAEYLKLFEPYVDIAQIRASEADPNHPTSFNPEETPFLRQAAYMKEHGVKMLIASVGGWQDPNTCERALAEGKIDLVSMARAWVSNPDYGKLVYEGRAEDIVPCLRCNKCHGRGPHDPFVSVCSVNPKIGIEHRLHYLGSAPERVKKVAVIGGGPAGMKAAMDLCDRGHQVTLYEITDSLGGAIKHADFVDFKWTLKQFKDYLIRQVTKRDIDVRLNTLATPEMIEAQGYDAVVVAAGAHPSKSPIPGLDGENVIFATQALMGEKPVGRNVVVIGGGEVGVETAMHLAKTGHVATVLEMRGELAADSTFVHYRSMFQEAWEAIPDFHSVVNARCTRVEQGKVWYLDQDNQEHALEADTVVVSAGMTPLQKEAMGFYGTAPHVYMIGDCVKPGTVQQAMRQAFATASEI